MMGAFTLSVGVSVGDGDDVCAHACRKVRSKMSGAENPGAMISAPRNENERNSETNDNFERLAGAAR